MVVAGSKSEMAIILSEFKDFEEHVLELEQYSTPSEIAADLLWTANLQGDIYNKTVADFACGPGFFGLGALLLGAKKVFLVDISENALKICKENYKKIIERFGDFIEGDAVFLNIDISGFSEKVDVVVENPPFGTKKKHHDKLFLEKAFDSAPVIYSMHKTESKGFIEAIGSEHGFKVSGYKEYDFMLRATQKFHRRAKHYIKVGMWRLNRI